MRDTKHLEKHSNKLAESKKEKTLFRTQRKAVEAGAHGTLEYTKEVKPNDEVIEDKGVKLFVDPGAIMYLLGTEMDYKKEQFSSSFIFKNPNETERCGCGESFKV